MKHVEWIRVSELTSYNGLKNMKPSLWGSGKIVDNTAEQGSIGDCWWLASANSVAEYPHLIKNLFVEDELQENGAITVRFFVNGEWTHVTVDDYVPVIHVPGGDYNFINNRPAPDGAMWLVLLEKAFAKYGVNYTNIAGGPGYHALEYFTGAPVTFYYSKDMTNDDVWNHITEGRKNSNPMAAASHYSGSFNNVEDNHEYSVLGTHELKNPDGSVHAKLIEMRNPWGFAIYNGPWNKKSSLWTPEFKK